MKTWKRDAVVAAVLLFVCGGIYLNWRYESGKAADLVQTLNQEKLMDDAALVLADQDTDLEEVAAGDLTQGSTEDYFARMRLSRQESRDSAVELLQETISYAGQEEDVSASSEKLDAIVSMALSEAQIESLIIAKGYTDCVAYMTDDSISVAVAAPEGGLTESDVALLSDLITDQSDYTIQQIRIIEVK